MKSKADKATKLYNAIIANVDDLDWEYEGTKYQRLIEDTSELFAHQWVFAMLVWRAARDLKITDESVVAAAAYDYSDLICAIGRESMMQSQMQSAIEVVQQ
jgi:hypothetical protein